MNLGMTRSTSRRAMIEGTRNLGPAADGDGEPLRCPAVSARGLSAAPRLGLLALRDGTGVDDTMRMVITSGSWRPQAVLDRSYTGEWMPWCEDRPRTFWLGPPSPTHGPHLVALERELEATRRELRRALASLRELGEGERPPIEGAMELGGRSHTARGDRSDASDGLRATCGDPATVDLSEILRAIAPADRTSASATAATRGAPCERLRATPDELGIPTRRVELPLGTTGSEPPAMDGGPVGPLPRTVFVVVDDDVMGAVLEMLRNADVEAVGCASGEAFLSTGRHGSEACLLTGACVAGVGGLDLVDRLRAAGSLMPAVVITSRGDVPMAVRAMRAGVSDVIEEPVGREALVTCVEQALKRAGEAKRRLGLRGDAARHVAGLTPRQREVMASVLAGHPSKNIAADLGISRRTVENHRASIMRKTGTRSLPALARLALAAEPIG